MNTKFIGHKKMYIIFLIAVFFFTGNEILIASANNKKENIETEFRQMEKDNNARIGVYALDTENGSVVRYRYDERFAYCSLAKVFIVGEILRQNSLKNLKKNVSYNNEDILSYAPITSKHIETGMTIENLCSAAIRFSDNTAGNLLLCQIGGINGFKKSLLNINDTTTQVMRNEPTLNTAIPGDTSDTSTPYQMAMNFKAYTLDNILPREKRTLLLDWMSGNNITDTLIRAGVPIDWKVADKSGSGGYGTRNDIAFITRPSHAPIILVVMTTHKNVDAKSNDALVAMVTKNIIKTIMHPCLIKRHKIS